MRNIKLVLEYDGTCYRGFQFQPGVPTVQGELERVLAELVKAPVTVYAAGRTDAGVHALGQVVNFKSDCSVPIEKMCVAMNSLLPKDIAIIRADEVDEGFHARYSAIKRVYRYTLLNTELRSAFECRYAWHVREILDVPAMQKAAESLLGVHDFRLFAKQLQSHQNTLRRVDSARVNCSGVKVSFEIAASGYLRSMVRTIVGALVDIGRGRRHPGCFADALRGCNSGEQFVPAPPQGLCLVKVDY